MTATRDIAEGEELFINYVQYEADDDRELRRRLLREDYGFWCDCAACSA